MKRNELQTDNWPSYAQPLTIYRPCYRTFGQQSPNWTPDAKRMKKTLGTKLDQRGSLFGKQDTNEVRDELATTIKLKEQTLEELQKDPASRIRRTNQSAGQSSDAGATPRHSRITSFPTPP